MNHRAFIVIDKRTGQVMHTSPYALQLTIGQFCERFFAIERKPKKACPHCGGKGHHGYNRMRDRVEPCVCVKRFAPITPKMFVGLPR